MMREALLPEERQNRGKEYPSPEEFWNVDDSIGRTLVALAHVSLAERGGYALFGAEVLSLEGKCGDAGAFVQLLSLLTDADQGTWHRVLSDHQVLSDKGFPKLDVQNMIGVLVPLAKLSVIAAPVVHSALALDEGGG
jgi:hypothetical protein